jgi:predicted RNase H-like nuclease (RuvC/YqgF family)
MSAIASQLENIVDKTSRLVEFCKVLQEENKLLQNENKALKTSLTKDQARVEELEEKLRVVKLARSLEGSNEKTLDIKQKINEFVREIDKCIVLLKK